MSGVTTGETTAEETTVHRRPVDIAATILLLFGHAVLAFLTFFVVTMLVMGTDNCAYVECGNQQWVNVGVLTAMLGGTALVIADLIDLDSAVEQRQARVVCAVAVLGCTNRPVVRGVRFPLAGRSGVST